jgi:hypothetical protein
MIAFACAITEVTHYEDFAGAGISAAAEPDSPILVQMSPRTDFRTLNLLLERASEIENLEALVLVHEKAEIIDPRFCAKLRAALSDPRVGVVGAIGATGVRSIAWWDGRVSGGSSVYRDTELHREEFPSLTWDGWNPHRELDPPGEVDTVDGVLLCLSPWVVENVRFDEALGPRYGPDFDLCCQVRAAGRRVITADLQVAHYYPLGVIEDPDTWLEAHIHAAEKWDEWLTSAPTETEAEWRRRARRAEGEAAAARLLSATRTYAIQALMRQQEREMSEVTDSASWRVTKPLREANLALARGRNRRP